MMSAQNDEPEQALVLTLYTRVMAESIFVEEASAWLDHVVAVGGHRTEENARLLRKMHRHMIGCQLGVGWYELGASHPAFQPEPFPPEASPVPDAVLAVVGVTVSAAVLPFLQSLASQAGQQAFDAARATARRVINRYATEAPAIHHRKKVVVEETATGLRFIVPPDLPDAALAALAVTDLESLAAPTGEGVTTTISWNETAQRWQREVTDSRA
ncbi:hypothetical protein DWB77_00499 [Streptomyces hundungensis]|uniref:Uncharacterized protein n=2 Tax=Streptomyces hundungensis TaxID=1077946 RepID=A0A387HCD2_9ACTN|nr:hypothetical protein DWB77_00499 [Streptomyces hundungensis]